jgi:integrase
LGVSRGGKLWRLKYRSDGRVKLLAIGAYPEISLGEARRRREEAREMIALGKDPSREKRRDKLRSRIQAADTFKAISDEFCQKRRRDGQKGWAPATATRSEYLLSLVCGSIGHLPIGEIEPLDVLTAIRRIEGKGKLESARRSPQLAGAVFRYAVATARLASDPTRDLRGALTAPTVTHYGAITDPKKVGELLRAIDDYEGSGTTKLALQIAPHVFVRPGELRHAEWSEIDLDGALWIIPAGKMKMRKPHHVPLSRQNVKLFRQVRAVTGPTGYVFPSVRTRARPMSENTINAGLRRLG